ncbi:MAG: SRPBCC family protein [Gemmatimonadota bacterium]
MATYEASTDIQATAERVWAALSTVEVWPQWLPTASGVEPLQEGGLEVGRRYRVTQPKLRPQVWTVTALEPGRRFEWRARSPGMELVADHIVEHRDPDAARVRLRFEFNGLVGALLGAAYGALTQSYLNQEAAAVKGRAEKTG